MRVLLLYILYFSDYLVAHYYIIEFETLVINFIIFIDLKKINQ